MVKDSVRGATSDRSEADRRHAGAPSRTINRPRGLSPRTAWARAPTHGMRSTPLRLHRLISAGPPIAPAIARESAVHDPARTRRHATPDPRRVPVRRHSRELARQAPRPRELVDGWPVETRPQQVVLLVGAGGVEGGDRTFITVWVSVRRLVTADAAPMLTSKCGLQCARRGTRCRGGTSRRAARTTLMTRTGSRCTTAPMRPRCSGCTASRLRRSGRLRRTPSCATQDKPTLSGRASPGERGPARRRPRADRVPLWCRASVSSRDFRLWAAKLASSSAQAHRALAARGREHRHHVGTHHAEFDIRNHDATRHC